MPMEEMQDRIDNYLLGRMSSEEADAMSQEISTNEDSRELYQSTRLVRQELADQETKRRLMQQWRRNAEMDAHKPSNQRKLWYSLGGVSAAAMVIWGLFMLRPEPTSSPDPVLARVASQRNFNTAHPFSSKKQLDRAYSPENKEQLEKIYQEVLTTSSVSYCASSKKMEASISSQDTYSQSQYEKSMREAEYYQKQAEKYRKEAESYKKQAESYEREQQYHLKQAEKYQREAAYYSKRGDYDNAKTQTRYVQNEIDKAKTQATYAKSAWDKYKIQMNYAKNADEKAAMYLKYARESLR